MSHGSELKSPGAMALRAAGFIPLPRLWVRAEDMDMIVWMATRHADEVNDIRRRARGGSEQGREPAQGLREGGPARRGRAGAGNDQAEGDGLVG